MVDQDLAMGARMNPSEQQLEAGLRYLQIAYPLLTFSYFIISLTITVCTLQTRRFRVEDAKVRRNVILGLITFIAGTYLAEAVTVGIETVSSERSTTTQHRNVYLLASFLIFGAQAVALTDSEFPVWYPYYGTWIPGAIVEIIFIVGKNWLQYPESHFDFIFIIEQALRICAFIALPSLFFGFKIIKKRYGDTDVERQTLLRKKLAGSEANNQYGSMKNTNGTDSETTAEDTQEEEDSWLAEQRKAKEKIAKRLEQDGNWFTYAKGFTVFFPYIWPYHSKALQFRAVLVGICLLTNNALNVLLPNQMGVMIDSLTGAVSGAKRAQAAYYPVLVYAALRFVSSGACIGWMKKWLWLPLEQYAYHGLSTASHAHLMSLSSDFHDGKTSSDLTQAVQGGRSVSNLLETVCFQVLPMFIDLAIAFGYLWSHYGPYMGLLMATTVTSYLYLTTKLISWRAERRRKYVTVYRKEWTVGQQSLDGWHTASLFNMIPHEQTRYASTVQDHMDAKRTYEMSAQATGAVQGLLMITGLLGALFLGVYQVTEGHQSVGKFTTLLVYWAQLQGPLLFFSNIYRNVSYSLMDAERLLDLFQTKPSITDLPNAKPLKLSKGVIKFDRVSFAYDDRKPTLKNVSFTVPAGKTVALVGETGGGKSTMLKLIDRFYDCKSGSITIDGQDIRDVQLSSLREKIGVVPQDPMLFNDTIMNNIRYARISATDREIYDACRAAAVHDKIMSFPDGYNSKVGDRGVKLSGGEKQRVAIARAILKEPEIILLDEATSAVDTETEQLIQEGFNTLCRGRTTFIVAHRLSTIMNADYILVVMHGEVIESGSHQDLVHSKGKYYDLWSKQIFVTPSTDRGRSKSPKKGEAHIINDLTSSTRTTELAKVMRIIGQKGEDHPEANGSTAVNGGNTQGGHKREGSKLKPDAPEFVPSHPAGSLTDGLRKSLSKERVEAQKKSETEEQVAAVLGKESGKKLPREIEDTNVATALDSQVDRPPAESKTDDEIFVVDRPKIKRSRPWRRNASKSEPSQAHESLDGATDSDVTAVSSGEGKGVAMRSVSAPSDPPGSQDSRGPRKRSRHWRLKNRTVENLSLTSNPNSSGGRSTEDTISAPAPSPANGPTRSIPTIRFAPGC